MSDKWILQGPTKQSLIDFFRMLWQCHVLLVICLEPLTDRKSCYPYFSFKKQQVVKVILDDTMHSFSSQPTQHIHFYHRGSTAMIHCIQVKERISLETRHVIETSVANLFVYEAVLTNMEIEDGGR